MGHIQRRQSGRRSVYQARYRDPSGREHARNFTRRSDADRHLATVEADKVRGQWTDPRLARITLGDWITEVDASRRHRRPTTEVRDESLIRNLILPTFADCQLGAVRPIDIDTWIGDLVGRGYSPATIHKAYQLLGRAFSKAVSGDLIPRTPLRDIDLPRADRPTMRFLAAEEIRTLADAIAPAYRALVLTAGFTGLRFGELAALRKDNLNLLRRTLRVEQTLTEVRGALAFGPPKTEAARRSVTIPEFLVRELAAHIAQHPGQDDLVFPSAEGGPIRRTNFTRRDWLPAVRATVGEPCRFHDLRHSHVALLIKGGQHPKVIASRLGHISVRTVLDVYGHLFEGLDEAAATALNGIWEGTADSTRTSQAADSVA
ncbi:MAG: site-specific integrase [Actinobacteria bacterium]|nr:site-specific integrase [Actinomycetota bacterium]